MISVCIPVYNKDVRALAGSLAVQGSGLKTPPELCIADDGSEEVYRNLNRELAGMKGVVYRELPSNRGRAAIRNYLADMASYPWLLFLDADSQIPGTHFLKDYLTALGKDEVICGGTLYSPDPPADRSGMLRWTYGRKREQRTAGERNKDTKTAITANNFMIRREVLQNHPFREAIRDYGHEDTVLGYDLSSAGIRVTHIDNPVVHTGLEPSETYLTKTESALENLLYIAGNIVTNPDFTAGLPLLKTATMLKKTGLHGICRALFRRMQPCLKKNLTGTKPRLIWFDLYRIGYLCTLQR